MVDSIDGNSKRDALHFMLQAALIEIRASSSLDEAKKFADVFHNLPMALLRCSIPDDYDTQLADLLERAKRCGLGSYVQNLQVTAMRAAARRNLPG